MLLGRAFAYADAQRNRIGTNFHQLPVNKPTVPVNSYLFDGAMTYEHAGASAVYAPNSAGRAYADGGANPEESWQTDTEMVRSAYALHAEDDDFGQAGTLVREVFNDAQREELVETVSGALAGVSGEVLQRALAYWTSIDASVGARIEKAVRGGADPQARQGMGEG